MAAEEEGNGRAARMRRLWVRSTLIATAGAFLGGVAVIGAQYLLLAVSAGYPPFVQSIRCQAAGETQALPDAEAPALAMFGAGAMASGLPEDGGPLMLPSVVAGTAVSCILEAPGADYAAWMMGGPRPDHRAGPLDGDAECQGREAFTSQDAQGLRVSACQTYVLAVPGLHLLSVKVMSRGSPAVDQSRLAVLVRPAPPPPPAAQRVLATVVTVPHTAVVERRQTISQTLSEHRILPTDRSYARVVHRLAPDERFLDARFEPRNASHASAVQIALDSDRVTVRARFALRSGPFIDRYSGWLNGDAVVRVEVSQPGETIELPEADLPVPGRAVLRLPSGATVTQVRLRRPDTGAEAQAPLGGTMRLGDAQVEARVIEGGLQLEASR